MLTVSKENKKLLWFTVLSYIDKGLAFILPLLVLYLFKDKDTYNDLEYAYSIANVAVYFFSVASIYSFYGYKEASDKLIYIKYYLSISCVSIIFTSIITIFLAVLRPELGREVGLIVYLLISARIVLLLFINFFSSYYRLVDKPSDIMLFTIAISISVVVLLGVFYVFSWDLLCSFAIPEILIPIFVSVYFLYKGVFAPYAFFVEYYKKSIAYAWPLLINCFLGLGVTNFGKIYAFNYMTSDDMYVFSYTMRISMVIGMAHTSILAFYSKQIYTNYFSVSILLKYALFLLSSSVLSFLIIISLNGYLPQKLPIDLTMLVIFIYNIIFFAGSFCEAFYGRANENQRILVISFISAIVFVLLILSEKELTILSISLTMLIYAAVRFLLMILGIKEIRKYLIKII